MVRTISRQVGSLLCALACLAGAGRVARAADLVPPTGAAILQNLKSFEQIATVLMIAAHPDDENTQLITYLARGRGYRMAYLSVTRGDGGQNLLGPEFGDELGLIRTNELLAARNLDLGRQFFTRARDFGFSKNPTETLKIWDQQEVLSDVVRVIRTFKPDVIVTRFSPTAGNTHGHHTASAILGAAAFKVAGDPRVLPDVPVWQPKRILMNAGGGGGGGLTIDAGGMDPVLNESFAGISGRSRAMHKTQGFGQGGAGGGRGGAGGSGPSPQGFQLLDGEPATKDIMDGIDTTWNRVGRGGAEIARLTAEAVAKFDAKDPSASVPALLAIKKAFLAYDIQKRTAELPFDSIVAEKRVQLDRLIADCLGLTVETTVPSAEVTPGEALKLHHVATLRATMPVKWVDVKYARSKASHDSAGVTLEANKAATRDVSDVMPVETPVSQPYWLRQEGDAGMFKVADAGLIGRPMNPPSFPVEFVFEVGGQTIAIADQPVQIVAGAPAPQARRPLDVIAPVSLAFPSEVRLFAPGTAKNVDVQVTAYRPNAAGNVQLAAPAGWKVSAAQAFKLAAAGDHATVSFSVTPPAGAASATLLASAMVGGQTYTTSRKEIRYDHLPVLLLQPPAEIKAVALNMVTRGETVGYLPGAGDSVAECLEQMGYAVTQLKTADLTLEKLRNFDSVVIGVRAFNTRDDLAPGSATLKSLFDYVAAGGTVVEQYNRPDGLRNTTLAPFNVHPSALRVTDENAAMKFLAADSPALNVPNKITNADFANWVQERSIYLPDQWGKEFTPVLGAADPGESPPNSALLVAKHGKGYFVYTSLVFFRQLPAGNPGAYRLFANLVSLGKE